MNTYVSKLFHIKWVDATKTFSGEWKCPDIDMWLNEQAAAGYIIDHITVIGDTAILIVMVQAK